MVNRPILFSAQMVRSLLAGTKTQTRRTTGLPSITRTTLPAEGNEWFDIKAHDHRLFGVHESKVGSIAADYCTIQPGDRLWVKETWRTLKRLDGVKPRDLSHDVPIEYVADDDRDNHSPRTRVSIHMPRWASRLTLHVTNVRVERLQAISDKDAIAEGIELVRETAQWGKHWRNYGAEGFDDRSPRHSYRTLWNSIHGHTGASPSKVEPWNLNPWVAAITLDVERCNIASARP